MNMKVAITAGVAVCASIVFAVELPESALRMVPQTGAAMAVVGTEPRHVSIWDYNISPSGEHYFSVCAEGTVSDYARLYRYLPESNGLKRVFRLEDVIITRDEAVRPSKLHSSIDFMPDGRVIMATHTTAAAPNHPRWMPFARRKVRGHRGRRPSLVCLLV